MRLSKLMLLGTLAVATIAIPTSLAAAAGFTEVITVNGPENFVGSNATGSASAFCPAGTQLVGGGGRWNEAALQRNGLYIVRDLPEFSDRWSVTGRNASGSGASIRAVALCGAPGPNQIFSERFSSTSPETFVNTNSEGFALASCPDGTQQLSGGFAWNQPQRNGLSVVQIIPSVDDWSADARNDSGSAAAFTAMAFCGRPGSNGFGTMVGETSAGNFVGGNNATGSAIANCPAGTQLLGGGGFFGNFGPLLKTNGLSLTVSAPFGPTGNPNSWTVTGRNSSGERAWLFANAICGQP